MGKNDTKFKVDQNLPPKEQELLWKEYVNRRGAEAFKKSPAEGMLFLMEHFENSNPFEEGERFARGHPIDEYTDLPSELVHFPASRGKMMKGVFIPVKNAKGTILALHGHSGNLYNSIKRLNFLPAAGYQILAVNALFWNYYKIPWDYTGDLNQDITDIHRAMDYLKERPDVAVGKIGLYGFSLGGIRALLSAAGNKDTAAVITDGANAYLQNSQKEWEDNKVVMLELHHKRFGSHEKSFNALIPCNAVRRITSPLLILQGAHDSHLPVENGEILYNKANEPKELYILPNSGHCDGMEGKDREFYISAVLNFLDRHMKSR